MRINRYSNNPYSAKCYSNVILGIEIQYYTYAEYRAGGICSIQIRLLEVNQNGKLTINDDASRRRPAVSNPIALAHRTSPQITFPPFNSPNPLHLSIYSSINPISKARVDLVFSPRYVPHVTPLKTG